MSYVVTIKIMFALCNSLISSKKMYMDVLIHFNLNSFIALIRFCCCLCECY